MHKAYTSPDVAAESEKVKYKTLVQKIPRDTKK